MPPPPLNPGEELLLSTRPHPITILTRSAFSIILLAVYAIFLMGPVAARSGPALASILLYAAIAVAALRLVLEVVRWLHRRYTLTSARLTSSDGLFGRWHVEMPLSSVQYVVLHKSITERALRLGTIGASSAGGGLEVIWLSIARPQHAHDTIVAARDASRATALHASLAGPAAGSPDATPPSRGPAPPGREGARRQPLVIGLAGGVGSGKSAVARILASLGAVISDSDAEARAALQSPDVKRTLLDWWGERILGPDGSIDRRAVADIVFADPAQRRRLEALIHPLLHQTRARLKADAAARAVPIVVIDAPLLYEAGVDGECDEVWFIDAPREQRLARVLATRGWDAAELDRREAAQMAPAEKRRRATRTVVNDGDETVLLERVRAALTDATHAA